VAAASVPLLAGNNWGSDVSVEGFKRDPDETDTAAAPKVAIVNEAFTKKFNLGRNAVDKHIGTEEDKSKLDTEIVGVVQNAKYSQVRCQGVPAC
jgi:hypothetical protein